jgi:hypothetical protein
MPAKLFGMKRKFVSARSRQTSKTALHGRTRRRRSRVQRSRQLSKCFKDVAAHILRTSLLWCAQKLIACLLGAGSGELFSRSTQVDPMDSK